jgi:hypothetical protein
LTSFDWKDASKWAELPKAIGEAGLSLNELGVDIHIFAKEAS